MLSLERNEEALQAFVRVYTTFATYKDLPSNKTVEFSSICSQIANLKYAKGDLNDALAFYQEAVNHAEGETEKKEILAAIDKIEHEIEHHDRPAIPVKAENIPELSHEFDGDEEE